MFFKKKEEPKKMVLVSKSEVRTMELGQAKVHLRFQDGSLHELNFRGTYYTGVTGNNQLLVAIDDAKEKVKNFIYNLNRTTNEEDLINVMDDHLPHKNFKRKKELISVNVSISDYQETKKFEYEVLEQEKTEGDNK